MPLPSSIDPTSSDFARNAEAMRALVSDLGQKLNQVAGGGGEASRVRHTSRGKMLARERVDLLIDPGTAFLELSPLAAYDLYGGDVHSASIVTGWDGYRGANAWLSPTTPLSRAAPITR
jgi:3-methylcrotonyl-CoA carboxylase beta subunit